MGDCWPSGIVLWGMVSNHHMLRWLKTVVVSDVEKAHMMRQMGIGKANASEPLMKRRKRPMTSKPERLQGSGMSLAEAR